jgi:hypothetical protein
MIAFNAVALWLLIASHFITAHTPDGEEVSLNTAEISSIRQPQDAATSVDHFAKGTKCVVVMTNGKFIALTDTCIDIIKRIAEIEK